MRSGWMISSVLMGGMVVSMSGCASIGDYRVAQRQNRTLRAEKEQVVQEMFDLRNNEDSVRTRIASLERELKTKDELISNLRGENELLDDMRRMAQGELEKMGQRMGDITVVGPRLPQPLDEALKRFAQENPSTVVYNADKGNVRWKSDLLFALGSDVVRKDSMASLKSFTDIIKSAAANNFEVVVAGHTDDQPIARASTKAKHPTNWHLSAHRAISVASILRTNGYSPARIGVMGCGEFRPAARGKTAEIRSQNRRVEIYLIPRNSIVPGVASHSWHVEGADLAFAKLAD